MNRELTQSEKTIVCLCQEKYGANPKDNIFFLSSGEAIMQVWGANGDGPWVHLTNLATWLEDGTISAEEIKETQM
jgi:hypothetical protein